MHHHGNRRPWAPSIGWAALVVLAIGCGSDPDAAEGAAGPAGSGGHGAGGEGTGAGEVGGSDHQTAPSNPEHGGIVQVFSGTLHGQGETLVGSFAMAFFWDAPGANAGQCTVTSFGACEVTTCTGGTAASTSTTVSAGAITIEGNETLTLVPDATNDYELVGGTRLLWDADQSIAVTAAGADVPAFSYTGKTSSAVTIISPPAPAEDTALTIDRAEDLVLVWTGGTAGFVTAMWKVDGSDPFTSIQCRFAASEGTGTVPRAALDAMPAGGSGDLLIFGGDIDALEAGEYTVQVVLNSVATWGSLDGMTPFVTSD